MSEQRQSHSVMTYPAEDQYSRWKERADERGMSMSEFVECMVEAGLKKFDATVTPDESVRELRKERNDLKSQLDEARNRIQDLEYELHHGEREAIIEFVEENPGVEYDEIIQHIIDTAPSRVNKRLNTLEGDMLRTEDGRYYITDSGDEAE